MKKKFKLQDLDCANCAAKMEEAIKRHITLGHELPDGV